MSSQILPESDLLFFLSWNCCGSPFRIFLEYFCGEMRKKKIEKHQSKVYRLEKERMMLDREAVTLESSLNFRGSRGWGVGRAGFKSGDSESLRSRGVWPTFSLVRPIPCHTAYSFLHLFPYPSAYSLPHFSGNVRVGQRVSWTNSRSEGRPEREGIKKRGGQRVGLKN